MERKIYFNNTKGMRLCAILAEPKAKTDKIIIWGHGFSGNKNSTKAKTCQPRLIEKGIAMLRIDYYGHGESDGDFADITLTEGADDIACAIDHAKSLDYSKIGVVGSSWGGGTSAVAVSGRDDVRILMLISPATDFAQIWESMLDDKGIAEWKERGVSGYLTGEGDRKPLKYSFYEDVKNHDVYNSAMDINAMALVVHGDADEVVPLEQSRKLVDAIGGNAVLEEYKGCDHRYSSEGCFNRLIGRIIEFISINLK